MRDSICVECGTRVDSCWRWCPECGSLELMGPDGATVTPATLWRGDDFAVEWEMDGDSDGRGHLGGRSQVRASA